MALYQVLSPRHFKLSDKEDKWGLYLAVRVCFSHFNGPRRSSITTIEYAFRFCQRRKYEPVVEDKIEDFVLTLKAVNLCLQVV